MSVAARRDIASGVIEVELNMATRYVSVNPWDMTDEELERQAAMRQAREPEHAAELRRFKEWRKTNRDKDTRPRHERGRELPITH